MVKVLLKDDIINQHSNEESVNIPISTTGSIICRWKVHRASNNPPACRISQHALRLKIRKVRETTTVSGRELQDKLKAVGKRGGGVADLCI